MFCPFGFVVILFWILAFFYLAEDLEAYTIQATFDAPVESEAYIVNLASNSMTRTIFIEGGNPYTPTTITIQAIAMGSISNESNSITLPPLVEECNRMDLNDDGIVNTTDILVLTNKAVNQECE